MTLEERLQQQLGVLLFQLLAAQAENEALRARLTALAAEPPKEPLSPPST